MTKYELSLTKDYVPGWTLSDAMRELFQNAIDQEATVPGNTKFFEYHYGIESIHIGNKMSVLEPKSLLLGASTKVDDPNTIGKFGEGYKIATLVLLRLGKKVTFFNYGAREVWRARFSKSRKYGAEILVFEVDKHFPWKAVPNNNLTIVVEGITADDYIEIQSTNLHLQEDYKYWNTPVGQILRDPSMSGQMFVNGLYITTNADFKFGYNFKPSEIELDRDRKLIQDFNLKWTTSKMWTSFRDEDDGWDYDAIDAVGTMLKENRPDVVYLQSASGYSGYGGGKYNVIAKHAMEEFKHDHGDNAVPVTSTDELNRVPSTHKAIVVSENYAKVIKSSPGYAQPELKDVPTLYQKMKERLDTWVERNEDNLLDSDIVELYSIIEEAKEDNTDVPF